MMLRQFTLGLVASLLVTTLARAEEFEIDPSHSYVGFAISHMVISKVKGHFNEFQSTLTYQADAAIPIQAVSTTIQTASIDTNNEKRDDHLRSPDFFNAAEHPQLTFVSKSIARAGDQWVATGTLTMHGVAKEIALPFKVKGPITDPWGNQRIGIEASLTISRKAYGLTWSKTLETGGLVVGDEVEIQIEAEYIAKK